MNGPLDARAQTRLRVLTHIRSHAPVPRIDIARALGLSNATVTDACTALIGGGLVQETETASAGRGRPRVLLSPAGDGALVAGVKVARRALMVMLTDFTGLDIGQFEMPLPIAPLPVDVLLDRIARALKHACQAHDRAPEALSGVTIGLPGFVNGETGYLHWSSSIVERNIDLGPHLSRHLPCPAFVENDANLVARAEHLFGAGRGAAHLLVVTLEHGVGMGIILNGTPYRGTRGCGAEFGHMKVQMDGAPCQCGQRGCLEAYLGDYALLRDLPQVPDIASLVARAEAGNAPAESVLSRASEALGVALANLVNLFDPDRIVIARSRPDFGARHTDTMMRVLRANTIRVDAALPEVISCQHDQGMWARGACAHALDQVARLKVAALPV